MLCNPTQPGRGLLPLTFSTGQRSTLSSRAADTKRAPTNRSCIFRLCQVWGLDFGDCHRSLFAHGDAITAVAFVRDTHYAFSAGAGEGSLQR